MKPIMDSLIKHITEGNSINIFIGPFLSSLFKKDKSEKRQNDEPQGNTDTIKILKTAFCFGLGVIAIVAITIVAIICLTTR